MSQQKKVLINYTNHPSHLWSEDQKTAALQQWSNIIDIQFPQTSPEWENEDVRNCFNQFYEEAKEKCGSADRDIMEADFLVMGEFRFTYYTVSRLISLGHKVYSHAGKRDVEIKDNKSIYTFRFGRFVEYFSD